ncbi:hypothetical protein AAMO2058_001333200 [Amorphochlora amoebiformis]|mmetsp:Transcript_23736/g.37326  ORF Transcript_23736/g.37326 Transcript_23736/m.37326 type:complete len:344 (-) Transcript_23736:62-1093(-)
MGICASLEDKAKKATAQPTTFEQSTVIGNVSPSCSPIAAEATSKFQMTDMASLRSLTSLPRIMLCKKREISGGEAIRTSSSGPNFRPKANLRAVFIEYVIDRSGSMLETGRVPLQQTLSLIREQREIALQTDTKIFLSVTTFNGRAKTHLDAVDLAETGEISEADVWKWLRPWGRTRLVDTALERLKAQDRHVRQYVTTKLKHIQQTHLLSTDPLNKSLFNSNNAALQLSRSRTMIEKRVVRQFVLITDGLDTMSKATVGDLKKAMESSRARYNTVGVFLASNQDAIESGKAMGFEGRTSLTFEAQEKLAREGFAQMSKIVAKVSRGNKVDPVFYYRPCETVV